MKCERSMRDRKSYREVRTLLREVTPPQPSADLWKRIETTLEERRSRSWQSRLSIAPLLHVRPVAAVAVVAALIFCGTATFRMDRERYYQANAHVNELVGFMQPGTTVIDDDIHFFGTF